MLNLADLAKFSMFLPTAKKRKPNVSNHIHFLTHGLFVGGWGVKKTMAGLRMDFIVLECLHSILFFPLRSGSYIGNFSSKLPLTEYFYMRPRYTTPEMFLNSWSPPMAP